MVVRLYNSLYSCEGKLRLSHAPEDLCDVHIFTVGGTLFQIKSLNLTPFKTTLIVGYRFDNLLLSSDVK